MPEYRVFQLDDAGGILGPSKTITCADDQDAIRQAREKLDGAIVEIWAGPRRVATLGREDEPRV
jgi:hypothetical protein